MASTPGNPRAASLLVPSKPNLSRRDLRLSLILGGAVAGILFLLARLWELPPWVLAATWPLLVVGPLGAAAVVCAGGLLGRRHEAWAAASKFAVVGVLNTALDLGVFNLLLIVSGIARGPAFAFFKALSFGVAVVNSYFWNKNWAFSAGAASLRSRGAPPKEFGLFLAVTIVGMGMNTAVATLLVEVVQPLLPLPALRLANVAALVALATSASWNFCAYRVVVFGSAKSAAGTPAAELKKIWSETESWRGARATLAKP